MLLPAGNAYYKTKKAAICTPEHEWRMPDQDWIWEIREIIIDPSAVSAPEGSRGSCRSFFALLLPN
jgi:hypothetical protein